MPIIHVELTEIQMTIIWNQVYKIFIRFCSSIKCLKPALKWFYRANTTLYNGDNIFIKTNVLRHEKCGTETTQNEKKNSNKTV